MKYVVLEHHTALLQLFARHFCVFNCKKVKCVKIPCSTWKCGLIILLVSLSACFWK